ncbi:uracil-DNA glycosylase family protein [Haloferula sp. BvORR071]|uniref:uracil-DNA glycosylase family protein n=1 Tax=Haloferula sp. BvORR071 TaxID=1396141 RepID=UPI0005507AA4|nr:uracil-DNA glycosylase family protein [Haloferula sp. BvORR071]
MPAGTISKKLIEAAEKLRDDVDALSFSEPVTHVYNPLGYAWDAHRTYLEKFGDSRKKIIFLGMNPGPWGMAQIGVPFGEIPAVRDWMGISTAVGKPPHEHPKRPVEGFACTKSEVSGRRLWGLFADRFGTADAFFADHLVVNYCPLVFMEESSRNRTPDKLPASEQAALDEVCGSHLAKVLDLVRPEWAIGVGKYAEGCLQRVASPGTKIGTIIHPSPASPIANRGWASKAQEQLITLGAWT